MTYLSKHNFLIKLCLQKRIDKGLDIFFMFKHQLKIVDLNNKIFLMTKFL